MSVSFLLISIMGLYESLTVFAWPQAGIEAGNLLACYQGFSCGLFMSSLHVLPVPVCGFLQVLQFPPEETLTPQ